MASFYGILLLLSFVLLPVQSDWFTDNSPDTCTGPRVRRNWCTLSDQDKRNYVNLVLKLKTTKIQPYTNNANSKSTTSLYDIIVQTHANSVNAGCWHESSLFPFVHRWFLYTYECALRYVARVYGPSLGITDPCSIALPYWPWENDYRNQSLGSYIPQDYSCIWDPKYFGARPSPEVTNKVYDVTTGQFNNTGSWVTNYATNGYPYPNYDKGPDPKTNTLKRYCNSTASPLTTSPLNVLQSVSTISDYMKFENWYEGGPHSNPHNWIDFYMHTTSSPDDPIFFLHHCNLERILCLWQDCWDYELVTNPTATQYPAVTKDKCKDLKGIPLTIGFNDPMPFWWKSSTGTNKTENYADSVLFPKNTWPSLRDMVSMGYPGKPGYSGMSYVYAGPDIEVALISTLSPQTFCPKNTVWNVVNQPDPYSKQNGGGTNNLQDDNGHAARILSGSKAKWDELKNTNKKSDEDTWNDLVDWDCRNTAKLELTDALVGWMKMMGVRPEQYDTICDSFSERYYKKFGRGGFDMASLISSESLHVIMQSVYKVEGAVIGVVLSVLVLSVVGIVLYLRKKNTSKNYR